MNTISIKSETDECLPNYKGAIFIFVKTADFCEINFLI